MAGIKVNSKAFQDTMIEAATMRLAEVGATPERTQSVLSFVRMMSVRGESFWVRELGFIPNTEDPFGTHKSNSKILIATRSRVNTP